MLLAECTVYSYYYKVNKEKELHVGYLIIINTLMKQDNIPTPVDTCILVSNTYLL